jgi:hypothetical protein
MWHVQQLIAVRFKGIKSFGRLSLKWINAEESALVMCKKKVCKIQLGAPHYFFYHIYKYGYLCV